MATEETDATADQASGGPVHKIRNLLAVIVTYCELIADEINDPAALKASLLEIRTAAERAQALADIILRATSQA
jgi:two-component sensor histidine kinase